MDIRKLIAVNELSEEELKELYKEQKSSSLSEYLIGLYSELSYVNFEDFKNGYTVSKKDLLNCLEIDVDSDGYRLKGKVRIKDEEGVLKLIEEQIELLEEIVPSEVVKRVKRVKVELKTLSVVREVKNTRKESQEEVNVEKFIEIAEREILRLVKEGVEKEVELLLEDGYDVKDEDMMEFFVAIAETIEDIYWDKENKSCYILKKM